MNDVKFFYMTKTAVQLGFDGRTYSVEIPDGECHIVYMERLLCGRNMEKGKRHDGRKPTTVKLRPLGVSLCKECQEGYKTNGQLGWHRWERNISIGKDGV